MNAANLAENDPRRPDSLRDDAPGADSPRPPLRATGAGDAADQSAGDGDPAAGGPAAGVTPSSGDDMRDEVFGDQAALRDELQDAHDRTLRAQAELENFRKRARRDLEDERRYASVPLLRDLLNVLDNLNRAIEAAGQHDTGAGLLEGVKMVAEQLTATLELHHCQRIDDLGTPFDPNLHESIGQEASEEYEAGVITRVVRTGYRVHDRVVRPSQVMISGGPPE